MNDINFRTSEFLCSHIQKTLAFYDNNVDDPAGGFYQNFLDNGDVYDKRTRHLVSSCRFVFNYAQAYLKFGQEKDLERVLSGIRFLRDKHFNKVTKGYYWLIDVEPQHTRVLDDTNHCYGLAFVILAYSWALKAGLLEVKEYLHETWQLMESKFWDNNAGLYSDEYNGDFSRLSGYRGQNANMHSCEAFIAAYDATNDSRFLSRAILLADNMVNRQAQKSKGYIWEHYNLNWEPDWSYNKTDPKNLFRPWGFQPGHHTEWAKLLLTIHRHTELPWLVARAKELFDKSVAISWDNQCGGLCYGFSPDLKICDDDKYFWVQAESFACAARLAVETKEEKYWVWYDRIWQYAWQNMIDHDYGAWYRILTKENNKIDAKKSPVGKTDYHTMGACYEVLTLLDTN